LPKLSAAHIDIARKKSLFDKLFSFLVAFCDWLARMVLQ
jgi:hypothetical protein